jgi:ubiquinone/menaquinone biosynthesis C-methylase UbiE
MDYRNSHLDPSKGITYEESFNTLPYRRIVWNWEKDILMGIIHTYYPDHLNMRYLDFACGTGRIIRLLESHMNEAYGVDVSEPMLSIAKKTVHSTNLLLYDLTKENVFPENYFDLITAFRFFLNAQNDLRENVLGVFEKILKGNGYLIFNIHMNKGCMLERGLKTYQWLKRIKDPGFNTISVPEVGHLLEKYNFKIINTFHFGVLPIYREENRIFINQINQIERLFSRFPSFLQASQHVIYLCRPCGEV